MVELPEVLARLDRTINYEAFAGSGIAAGRIGGLSLDSMREFCALLGDPQEAVPVIHITGTNGKGSVAAMVSELIAATGLNAGTYTSPHLDRINERIARNGEAIPDDELAEVLSGVLDVAELADRSPSWFELVTAAAFRWFSEASVDVAVIEVGLLGRYDATNVVTADVAVITNIGADHTDGAPGWELAVASEKAGIITPGRDVVVGALGPELLAVVEAEGPERVLMVDRDIDLLENQVAFGGRTISVSTPWGRHDDVYVPLHGEHQGVNAALAIVAVEAFFDRPVTSEQLEVAFGRLNVAGRVEVVGHDPLVILDGAHNADSATALARTLADEFIPLGSRIAVIGMLEGREPSEVLRPLAEFGLDLVLATAPPSPRAAAPEGIAAAAEAVGIHAEVVVDPWAAVGRALRIAGDEDMVVIAGSFYLVGPARRVVAASKPDRPESRGEDDPFA